MSSTICISLGLGSSKTGLSLQAQIVDFANIPVGGLVTTGFSEIGSGNYMWNYSLFPDSFRGGVKFYDQSSQSVVLSFVALNPVDFQTTSGDDIKIIIGHSDLTGISTGVLGD